MPGNVRNNRPHKAFDAALGHRAAPLNDCAVALDDCAALLGLRETAHSRCAVRLDDHEAAHNRHEGPREEREPTQIRAHLAAGGPNW